MATTKTWKEAEELLAKEKLITSLKYISVMNEHKEKNNAKNKKTRRH